MKERYNSFYDVFNIEPTARLMLDILLYLEISKSYIAGYNDSKDGVYPKIEMHDLKEIIDKMEDKIKCQKLKN